MAKKQPKRIAKITHVKLTKKNGEKFDFTQPFGDEVASSTLSAPRIDSGLGGTYIHLPEFLEFKKNIKQATENPQLLLEETIDNAETIDVDGKQNTKQQKVGAFEQYFKEENVFGKYRKKAGIKSLVFGVLSLLSLIGLIFCTTIFSWPILGATIALGIVFILATTFFFLLSVDVFAVHILVLIESLVIVFASALLGMFNIVTLMAVLLFAIVMIVAFKETERQQIINRIFDIFHNTRPASRLLHIGIVVVLFLSISNFYSTTVSSKFYTTMIDQSRFSKYLDSTANNSSALDSSIKEVFDVQSFAEFTTKGPKTVQDFLVRYEYNNDVTSVLDKAQQNAINRDPLLTLEEKTAKQQSTIATALNEVLTTRYSIQPALNEVLSPQLFYPLMKERLTNQLSSVSVDLPQSKGGFFAITQKFPAILVGFVVAVLYSLIWWVYKLLLAMLNFFGISPEKIVWWILKKTKTITIEHEKLDAEIIIV